MCPKLFCPLNLTHPRKNGLKHKDASKHLKPHKIIHPKDKKLSNRETYNVQHNNNKNKEM